MDHCHSLRPRRQGATMRPPRLHPSPGGGAQWLAPGWPKVAWNVPTFLSHFATHTQQQRQQQHHPLVVGGGTRVVSPSLLWCGCGAGTTAPLTAGSTEASGTFNPLCKVLCILQSLYLCTIGPMLVFCLARDTPCTSNCSPKPLYSWIQVTAPQGPWHTVQRYGTVSLCCGPFQGTSWHHSHPGALTRSTAHSIIWIPQ